jgi:signal peptidase II
MRNPLIGWLLFATAAAVATASDLLTKEWIFERLGMPGDQPAIMLINGMLALRTNLNEGALFGMGQGLGLVFAAISFVALTGIGLMVSRLCRPGPSGTVSPIDLWSLTALGLITGGILGNLYDRLGLPGLTWHTPAERFGEPVRAVRDWIHFAIEGVIDWPIFNLADSYLVVGAGILVVVSLLQPRPVFNAESPELQHRA